MPRQPATQPFGSALKLSKKTYETSRSTHTQPQMAATVCGGASPPCAPPLEKNNTGGRALFLFFFFKLLKLKEKSKKSHPRRAGPPCGPEWREETPRAFLPCSPCHSGHALVPRPARRRHSTITPPPPTLIGFDWHLRHG